MDYAWGKCVGDWRERALRRAERWRHHDCQEHRGRSRV